MVHWMVKAFLKLKIHGDLVGVCKDIYILLEMVMEKENVESYLNHLCQLHDLYEFEIFLSNKKKVYFYIVNLNFISKN